MPKKDAYPAKAKVDISAVFTKGTIPLILPITGVDELGSRKVHNTTSLLRNDPVSMLLRCCEPTASESAERTALAASAQLSAFDSVEESWIAESLEAHNKLRTKHGVPPLTW
jgi:uncharacterized protein YkwD